MLFVCSTWFVIFVSLTPNFCRLFVCLVCLFSLVGGVCLFVLHDLCCFLFVPCDLWCSLVCSTLFGPFVAFVCFSNWFVESACLVYRVCGVCLFVLYGLL